MIVRIATRKSALAIWQAEHVAAILRELAQVSAVELLLLSTRGDEILDKSLQAIGGKGLFIKELEVAMLDGRADVAVHSMKDVPAEMPDGFCVAAVLERANPFDALVANDVHSLSELPRGALVGSSSLRRQSQLLALRPDLKVEPVRGNVNTRLQKLDDGQFDAIMLACAGLERLGMAARISEQLNPDDMLPASAQGVIGIECRHDRTDLRELLATIEHAGTKQTTLAERAVTERLQATCHSPLASYATLENGGLLLKSLAASADGRHVIREQITGAVQAAEALGFELAERMLALGAADLLGIEVE
ncbi:MAG: hydroxymethylbilane synthase [Gammaproteobacteria bacterium]|nr:hydroxymethylbilane synthase [Gammaproteobacteria bacterium]